MNTKLLSISLTLPVLIIGAGQSLVNLKLINQGNSQNPRSAPRTSQVKLDTQQPPPFLLAARDDEKKECEWLGICDGPKK